MKKRGIAQKIKYLGIGITLFIQTVYGTGATVNAENLVSTESLIEESESDSYFSYNIIRMKTTHQKQVVIMIPPLKRRMI